MEQLKWLLRKVVSKIPYIDITNFEPNVEFVMNKERCCDNVCTKW